MPEFVLNRNYTLRSTHGHIINFKKDVPVSVPVKLIPDAIAIGAVPTAEIPETGLPTDPSPPVILDAATRRANIKKAFKTVLERGQRGDFTASGHPHVRSLSQICAFEVDAKERDVLWQEYSEEREEAKANT